MSFELVFGYAAGLYGNDKGPQLAGLEMIAAIQPGHVTMGTGGKR